MKNRVGTRLLAVAPAAVMRMALLPAAACAALRDNSPGENQEILSQLRERCGSRKEAGRHDDLPQDDHRLQAAALNQQFNDIVHNA